MECKFEQVWDEVNVSESASYLILCLVASGQQAGVVLGVRFPVVSFVALCGLPQSLQKLVVLRGLPHMPVSSLTDTGQADHRRPLVTLTTVAPCLYSSSFYSTWLALRRYVPLLSIWDTPLFPLSHLHPAFCLNLAQTRQQYLFQSSLAQFKDESSDIFIFKPTEESIKEPIIAYDIHCVENVSALVLCMGIQ